MKSFAKISMDSLRVYRESVQSINDYSSTATSAEDDFEKLIDLIDNEIAILEEKVEQLKNAKSELDEKIADCEARIEELESSDDDDKDDDEDGDEDDLDGVGNAIELMNLEGRLNNYYSVEDELLSVLSDAQKRISVLFNNKKAIERNLEEYSSTIKALINRTTQAHEKLTMIDKCLSNYIGIRVKVEPAFDSVNRNVDKVRLSDLEYMTPKFKNAPSRGPGKSYYDDEGKMYKNSEGLVPNSTFRINNYTFTTDSLGRSVTASGRLRLETGNKDRNWDSTLNEMGRGDEKEGDNRGHKIGHRFGGPDSMANAFPQDEGINKGEYKSFEDSLALELESGKEIFISITTIYSGDSRRPTGVAVSYTIDGVRRMRFFDNESKEGGDVW